MNAMTNLFGAAALSFVTCVASAQDKGPVAAIVGTWKVVTYEDRTEGQPVKYQFGEKPRGLLMYDATGHMSIQLMKVPHPKVAARAEEQVTPQEKIALYDAYTAYFGTYTVDAKRGVVTHHVEGDLADVFIGTDQQRPFEISGDRLILRPKWTEGGRQWTGLRVFERAK
jgi:hypothetical protein